MRAAVSLLAVLSCAALSGCLFVGDDDDGGGGGGGDDGVGGDSSSSDDGPASGEPDCVSAETRARHTVIVAGSVLDWATQEPVDGADVEVTTSWDTLEDFPDACPSVAALATGSDGRFGPEETEIGSPLEPPIVLFMVSGDDLAETASDQRLVCDAPDCGNLAHTIAAPSRDLAAGWRAELERGGMANAAGRGLVLFSFRNPDGTPAEGVTPWRSLLVDTQVLEPGSEVRFLEEDLTTLAPPATATTTASGVALIGVDEASGAEFIGGSRDSQTWVETGVLDPPGWFFLEDRQQSPE
jgi:hypothetical protein